MMINSIVLYDLFYALFAPKHHTDLYRLMKLETKNTGPRFRMGRNGKSYFPRHEEWLENALYDVPDAQRGAWLAPASQAFPDPTHANLTLASHLYNLLCEGARAYPGGSGSVYDAVLKVCTARGVCAGQMRDIAAIGPSRIEDVLHYVVRCAKNANDDPAHQDAAQPADAQAVSAVEAACAPCAPIAFTPQLHICCIEDAPACPPDAPNREQLMLDALENCNELLAYVQRAGSTLLRRLTENKD